MSEAILEEETPNPYNARKSWHKPDKPKMGDADGLFYEPQQQATLEEEAPEEEQAQPQKRANYKKRYDDLKRHYDQRVSEFKQRFKEENPDLYETLESVAHLRSQEQLQGFQQKLSALEEREKMLSRKEAESTLLSKHPDFEDIRGDDKFHSWAKEQPEQIQDWIYNNPDNVSLAAKAIDLYKLENGITQTKSQPKPRQQRGSAADMVSTKTTSVDAKQPKIWTEGEIAAMSLDQFDKVEDEIKQAMIEGRVVK